MKILITGATGRLGANLTKQLIDRGDEVRALVIPDDPKKSKLDPFDVDLVEGDLRDADLCHKLVDGVDAVVHTANILGPPRGMDNQTFYDINVTGTYNLFEAAAPLADKLHRFVHVSTDAVYPMGNQHIPPCYQPINEIHPKRPRGLYPTLKYMNEAMAEGYMNGFDLQLSIIRPSGMFAGKEVLGRWTVQFVTGRLREAANRPESGIHHPDGAKIAQEMLDRAERPDQPCAITDTARACVCALDHPAAVGEAFNAPIYRPMAFPDVAAYLAEKTGIPPLKVEAPVQWIYWSDNSKARTLIGYDPQCTLENIFDTALADQAGEPADVISA